MRREGGSFVVEKGGGHGCPWGLWGESRACVGISRGLCQVDLVTWHGHAVPDFGDNAR